MTSRTLPQDPDKRGQRLRASRQDRDAPPSGLDAAMTVASVLLLTIATTYVGSVTWSTSLMSRSIAAESDETENVPYGAPRPNFDALNADLVTVRMREADIHTLQTKLGKLGFEPGYIDGVLGGRTLDALNRYRESKNLPGVASVNYGTVADLLE
jgi:hypothetical protein